MKKTIRAWNDIRNKMIILTGEEIDNQIDVEGESERWIDTGRGNFNCVKTWVTIREIKIQLEDDVAIIKHTLITKLNSGKILTNEYSFNYLSDLKELERIDSLYNDDEPQYWYELDKFYKDRERLYKK